jgi:hypothetical protein
MPNYGSKRPKRDGLYMFLDKGDILGYRIIEEKIKTRTSKTLEVSFPEKPRRKLDGWTSPPWR